MPMNLNELIKADLGIDIVQEINYITTVMTKRLITLAKRTGINYFLASFR